ncbi:LysR substrate-binding domain-containing protein, partial [Acinetobacter baumannii]
MVASGLGVTVLPRGSTDNRAVSKDDVLTPVPITAPAPTRRIALVWRKSFPRMAALRSLREGVLACGMRGVRLLGSEAPVAGA